MKIIHDLKNPAIAVMQSVNDTDIDITKLREIVNTELEDLQDMLDNLRAEFKHAYRMNMNESAREVNTKEFLKSLKRTHLRLAKNGKNHFRIESIKGFPVKIHIPRINIKRVANNIISNALKHTHRGKIEVKISIENENNINSENIGFLHVGASILKNTN